MNKNLVIVESPTKAKTIKKFLGSSYDVESSFGHVRDLPASKMGVDVLNDFEPSYTIPTRAKKNLSVLKKLAKTASTIYFATDEDREGEAISWHLNFILKPKDYKRICFHEITKDAILEALKNPRELDMNLINAQQARRILDRLVGYEISPFLWKKIAKGLSAGRVQSAALRLICEREQEIKDFNKQEYWSIKSIFQKIDSNLSFESELIKISEKTLDKFYFTKNDDVENIITDIKEKKYSIESIEKKEASKNPLPPFTTSTLQQASNIRLGYSSKQTMMLAQQLYEGIKLGKESLGLITYMRTDSLNLSTNFIEKASSFITSEYGKEYLETRQFKTKSKNAQEAHEAIRPTDVTKTPELIKEYLDPKQYKVYKLIWERAVASQMSPSKMQKTKIIISDKEKNYSFMSSGNIITFYGFLKVYPMKIEEGELPELKKNEALNLKNVSGDQHFTEPPARYNEASLIKIMEKLGIGRPSTYAPTISNIIARRYVIKEQKRLMPTETGELINKVMVESFKDVVDYQFTATMEEGLDDIARGEKEWVPFLRDFYTPFKANLKEKYETVSKIELEDNTTDEVCEKCGSPMIIKLGRFGKFKACSNFPECKNTKNMTKELGIKCPKCENGNVVTKRTSRGKTFYGCNNYPKCDFATWYKPTGTLCEKCKSPMVEFKNGEKCSNKDCK